MNAPMTHAAATTVTERLADFALGASLSDLSEAQRKIVEDHLLDAAGIALASQDFDFGTAIIDGAKALGGAGEEAEIFGTGIRLPAASAALGNGALVHGLDFDDTHVGAIYHASAPAFGAAMTAGLRYGRSGAEVLTAFAVALEAGIRVARAGAGEFHARGFHPTALGGTFAACLAVGRLAGLDRETLVSALGMCGSFASGVLEFRESWLKRLHPGWSAHSAFCAVAMAQAGFRGPRTVLEGPQGFFKAHLDRPEAAQSIGEALGEDWQIEGLALKPYPCCHFTHSFVDAALELREETRAALAEGRLVRIECPLDEKLHHIVGFPRDEKIAPPTIYDALFSVPWIVAVATELGQVDLAAFYDTPLDHPELKRIAAMVHCLPDPESDYPARFPGEVRLIMTDGTEKRCRMATSLGTPEKRLPRAAVEAKFRGLAGRVLSPEACDGLIDLFAQFDRLDRLDRVFEAARI